MRKTGTYQTINNLNSFIPDPLPPTNPTLTFSPELVALHDQASFALGKLNEMSSRLPDPQRFIKTNVIKEALLSSAIEGIYTTLIDVFTGDSNESKPSKDTQLVLNYTYALNTALDMMHAQNLPLASRVILAAHKALLAEGSEEHKMPGSYRKQSVRVGQLIPPPANEVPSLMTDLEKFIHEQDNLTPLIKAGLVHVQFETIHPFLDGNGRIGRLLIILMFIESGLLQLPIIYPSLSFKKHHLQYYQALDRVRTHGDFEGWITYFLTIIRDSTHDAYKRIQEIEALELTLKNNILQYAQFTKIRPTALMVLDYLFKYPVTTVTHISTATEKSYNTIANTLKLLASLQLVTENTTNKRNKTYHFTPYLNLLEKEY
jgi:Fic family protein